MTTLLVLLVRLIGGGLYGGWQYVQGQYYVGVQDGNVAIFRGVNQNLARHQPVQPHPANDPADHPGSGQ